MKIYDISQEVFGCQVYAGDPAPEKELLSSMEEGGLYNLTAFRMCAHNGTHIDAPFHFIQGGKAVDSIDLDTFVGLAYVAEHHGIVSADDAAAILENAKKQNPEAAKRILIKGDAEVSSEAATVFAASNMLLLGNESQTVGPENAPILAILQINKYRGNLSKQMISMMGWVMIYAIVSFFFVSKAYGVICLGVILVYPFLRMYNGERGKAKWLKWFFYIYYPLHLIILGILRIYLYGADVSLLL